MQNQNHNRYSREYRRNQYLKRRKRVDCILTLAEFDTLKQEAQKSGRAPTTYLREAAFAYMQQRYLVPRDLEGRLTGIIVLLRSISNNINQIARHTNKIKCATIFNLLAARGLINKLETAIRKFLNNPSQSSDGYKIHEPQDPKLRPTSTLYQHGGEAGDLGSAA